MRRPFEVLPCLARVLEEVTPFRQTLSFPYPAPSCNSTRKTQPRLSVTYSCEVGD